MGDTRKRVANTFHPAKKMLSDTGTVMTKGYDAVVVTVSLYTNFFSDYRYTNQGYLINEFRTFRSFQVVTAAFHSTLKLTLLNTKLRDLVIGTVTNRNRYFKLSTGTVG
jgi:hypothetical protein